MFNTVMAMIDACGNDVDFYTERDMLYLTINDFDGFDSEWNEIMRAYDHPEAVNALLDWLNENCISRTNGFYTFYSFDGFTVELGYASFDI